MSDEKPVEAKNADDLTKIKKQGDVQLNEEELNNISGGPKVIIQKGSGSPQFWLG